MKYILNHIFLLLCHQILRQSTLRSKHILNKKKAACRYKDAKFYITSNQIKINKTKDNRIKSIRNLFRSERKNNAITDKIIRDMHFLFEEDKEDEDYYKPVRISNAFDDNFIEY